MITLYHILNSHSLYISHGLIRHFSVGSCEDAAADPMFTMNNKINLPSDGKVSSTWAFK